MDPTSTAIGRHNYPASSATPLQTLVEGLLRRLPMVALTAITALILIRVTGSSEFVAAYGSERQRLDLCRSIPKLAEWRQLSLLMGLVNDESDAVRLSALTAAGRCRARDELDNKIESLLRDETTPQGVRCRAAEVLLDRDPVRNTVLTFLEERVADGEFRRTFPSLVALYWRRRLDTAGDAERTQLVAISLDEHDPSKAYLQQLVLDRIREFRDSRGLFIEDLERDSSFETQRYSLAALTAIDGMMRGEHADDWRQESVVRLAEGEPFVYEAEWAHDIRPNYHIAEIDGATCLGLGEGAGGLLNWLNGVNGTVDLGSARFNLLAPAEGEYEFWARVYFQDKCGNSFGIQIDGGGYTNFPDASNIMRRWHWLRLNRGEQSSVPLSKGLHRCRLDAWEDGVFIDKFVLMPKGRRVEDLGEKSAIFWDASITPSLSFALQYQHQVRGTTQFVTVWVRRNRPELRGGRLTLTVPEPFQIVGEPGHALRFAEDNPLIRSTYRVRLAPDAVAGEGMLRAVYTDDTGETLEGRFIIGAHMDWLSTGPVKPDDGAQARLAGKTELSDEELHSGWQPYPPKGYDAYRRLNFEDAYGQLQNVWIYLAADIFVEKSGNYLALLTADDTSAIYIDGRLAVAQDQGGPGEGRMVTNKVMLSRGRHRIFVRHYQADFADPVGGDNYRHTYNHCVLKLLLRESRHTPATTIKGLPRPQR